MVFIGNRVFADTNNHLGANRHTPDTQRSKENGMPLRKPANIDISADPRFTQLHLDANWIANKDPILFFALAAEFSALRAELDDAPSPELRGLIRLVP